MKKDFSLDWGENTMTISKEMLYTQLNFVNTQTGLQLVIQFFNGCTWLKDLNGNTISVGTKKDILNDLYLIYKITVKLVDLHTDWIVER